MNISSYKISVDVLDVHAVSLETRTFLYRHCHAVVVMHSPSLFAMLTFTLHGTENLEQIISALCLPIFLYK